MHSKYDIPPDHADTVDAQEGIIINNTLRCVRNKYMTTPSCESGKAYDDAFKGYSKWIKAKQGYSPLDNFSPCSRDTVEAGIPWLDFILACPVCGVKTVLSDCMRSEALS